MNLTLTAPSDEMVVPLANSVRSTLQHYHKEPDFEITVPLELLRQTEQTSGFSISFWVALPAISCWSEALA